MIVFFVMGHVILFLYILIFSTGFASLVGLAVIASRLAQDFVKRMFLVQSLFIANLAVVAIYYYVAQILGLISGSGSLDMVFSLVAGILSIALYVSILFLLTLNLVRFSHRGVFRIAFYGTLVTIAMQVFRLLGFLLGDQNPLLRFVQSPPYQIIAYFCVAVVMGCLGALLLKAKREEHHRSFKTLLTGIGVSCIVFVPLGLIELALKAYTSLAFSPVSLEYLLYLGINVSILIALVQVLVKQPNTGVAFGELPDEVVSRFSLTAREKQMATLIAQGFTNKEIAFKLGISEATVRTHIYNVFQKVGAQSRIELLNLLHS